MSDSPATDSLDRAAWLEQEAVIERFESAWQEQGRADLAAFLPADGPGRRALLVQLARVDLECRWAAGDRRRVEDYVRDFPELAGPDGPPLELVLTEVEVAGYHGQPAAPADLAGRFPGLAGVLEAALPDAGRPADTAEQGTVREHPQAAPAAPPAPWPADGPRRLGRYELRESVGRGSFAQVYRAWDPQLRRIVAVKVPRDDLLQSADFRDRLLREARSAARLRHPAIVPLYEVGEDAGQPFLVYEFITGPTLAQLLRQTTPTPEQAADWVARLADALDYAHAAGIVHRDVKPANVLMAVEGGGWKTARAGSTPGSSSVTSASPGVRSWSWKPT